MVAGGAHTTLEFGETPASLRDSVGLVAGETTLQTAFDLPVRSGVTHLSRTHPMVAGLAAHLLDEALDPLLKGPAARAGVVETDVVTEKTVLLLCRFRMNLVAESRYSSSAMLAEDAVVMAFTGEPTEPLWLSNEDAEPLLELRPAANVDEAVQRDLVAEVLAGEADWRPGLDIAAHQRADNLAKAHAQVRQAAGRRGGMLDRRRSKTAAAS